MSGITMGVYKITSNKNKKIYVGSSIDIELRRKNHFNQLRRGIHKNKKLQNHYNKYGANDLVFEIIEKVDDISNLLVVEQKYIDEFDSFKTGFNMAPIAGHTLGYKHSDEVKQKLSQMQIGKKLTEEHRKKISQAGIGRIQTEETRKKLSEATKGKPKSETARKNMSESAKNRPPISEETRQKLSEISKSRVRTDEWKQKIAQSNSKGVCQFDLEGNFIQEFNGAKTAADVLGIQRTSIVNVLTGKSKTAGGFVWRYAS